MSGPGFLLDDHEVVRRGVRELLADAGIADSPTTGSAAEAIRRIPALRPDVAVLDARTAEAVRRKLRRPEDHRLAALTERESKILALVADGLTNRQIAEKLFIAEKTVESDASSLFVKLGVRGRSQAALYGRKRRDS